MGSIQKKSAQRKFTQKRKRVAIRQSLVVESVAESLATQLTLDELKSSRYVNLSLKQLLAEEQLISSPTELCLYLYAMLNHQAADKTLKTQQLTLVLQKRGEPFDYLNAHILPHVAEHIHELNISYFFASIIISQRFEFKEQQEIARGLLLNPGFDKTNFFACLHTYYSIKDVQASTKETTMQLALSIFPDDEVLKWELIHQVFEISSIGSGWMIELLNHVKDKLMSEEEKELYPESWVIKYLHMWLTASK